VAWHGITLGDFLGATATSGSIALVLFWSSSGFLSRRASGGSTVSVFFLRIRVRTLRFRTISIQDDRFCIITTGPRILTASTSSTGHKTKITAEKFNSAFSVI